MITVVPWKRGRKQFVHLGSGDGRGGCVRCGSDCGDVQTQKRRRKTGSTPCEIEELRKRTAGEYRLRLKPVFLRSCGGQIIRQKRLRRPRV